MDNHTTAPCADCDQPLRWESTTTPDGEVWLGTCENCGLLRAFLAGDPDLKIDDPLAFFLRAGDDTPLAECAPAWQRLHRDTSRPPHCVPWRYRPESCAACNQAVVVGQRQHIPLWDRAFSLCLACGHVRVVTALDSGPICLEGAEWSPACPAVQMLRATVFAPWRLWGKRDAFFRRMERDDD